MTRLVIRPGQECWIGPKREIAARVVQVSITQADLTEVRVSYQVAWWDGNNRKCEWLEQSEVESISPNGPFLPIGFHGGA